MSKQTEALKLAREMLIENREYIQMYERPSYLALYDKAIARVEEAMADHVADNRKLAEQPAQPIKQGWDVDDLLDKPKQPAQQQEPVAICEYCEKERPVIQAEGKPWRGLTDEEKADLFEGTAPYYNEADYADAIEAKLREKNHG